jgi:hypothetical protein
MLVLNPDSGSFQAYYLIHFQKEKILLIENSKKMSLNRIYANPDKEYYSYFLKYMEIDSNN